jgi:membrane fusion protein, multidrug efflux system
MSGETEKETAKQAELENLARVAYAEAATEKTKREAAERAAQDAMAIAAGERATREGAEKTLHEASIRSSQDLTAERVARESAEKAAIEANSRAAAERAAREAAEARLTEIITVASAKGMPAPTPGVVGKAATPNTSSAAAPNASSAAAPNTSSAAAPNASAAAAPQTSKVASAATTGEKVRNWLVPLAIFAAAGIMFFFIATGWTVWENNVSVKTDDAYVRADVAPLSTKSSGIVKETKVNDFQSVKAGQILVELKNDEYKARVDQAKEAIRQVEIKIADMKQRKEQQDARVAQAKSALENSRTSIAQADDTIRSAQASIEEAKAGIEGANASIIQSAAATKSAAADLTRSALERTRQEALLATESATREKVEAVVNDHERALANLDSQKAAQGKAKAELAQRKAQLNKAAELLSSSRSEKAKSLLTIDSHQSELTAQMMQRELLNGEEKQLVSDLAVKKAGLTTANVDFDYTIVRAPTDGIVGELKVKPGQLVNAGTQVITIISAEPWVLANYRETQLVKVKEGDRAEVTVDALPGAHFIGHVERISPASGAEFSLLPPDNASGNFTKVTQRITVKICFDEDKQKLASLRPGMSVTATIMPGTKGASGK